MPNLQYLGSSHGGDDFYGLGEAESKKLVAASWAPHEQKLVTGADMRRAAPPSWEGNVEKHPYLGPSDTQFAAGNRKRAEPDPISDASRADVPSLPGCPGKACTEHWAMRAAEDGSDEARVDAAMGAVRGRRNITSMLRTTPGRGGGQLDVVYLRVHQWERTHDYKGGIVLCAAESMAHAGVPDGRMEQWAENALSALPLSVSLAPRELTLEAAADDAADDAQAVPDSVWKHAIGGRYARWRSRCLDDVKQLGWEASVKLWLPRLLHPEERRAPSEQWSRSLLRLAHAVRATRRRATEARLKEVGLALAEWCSAEQHEETGELYGRERGIESEPRQWILGAAEVAADHIVASPIGGVRTGVALSLLAAPLMYLDALSDLGGEECDVAAAYRFYFATKVLLQTDVPPPQPSEATPFDCPVEDDLALLLPQEQHNETIELTEVAATAARSAPQNSKLRRILMLASRRALRGVIVDELEAAQ